MANGNEVDKGRALQYSMFLKWNVEEFGIKPKIVRMNGKEMVV
jgi:hypothetical protein